MVIRPQTIRAGVIGHPINHSLSPALHGRWLDRFGIDGTYDAVACEPDGFAAKIAELRAAGWAGINVTLPFKGQALALADQADDTAQRTGSANTLVFSQDAIVASNTDAPGFAGALRAAIEDPPRSALVLGAGGTAPAILAALSSMGTEKLRLSNRTQETAEALAARFGAHVIPWDDRHDAADTDVLVNATALGLPGNPALDIDLSRLPASALVADCIYRRGGMTPLVTAARARGLAAFDGLPMLVRQAIPGFAAWFGQTPTDLADAEAHLRSLS